jgi:hypothetical protein
MYSLLATLSTEPARLLPPGRAPQSSAVTQRERRLAAA